MQPFALFKSLRNDNSGIFWVITVGVITIMVSTVCWLIAMLVTNQFIDIFGGQSTGAYTAQLGETLRTQGAVVIVVIDVGMIVWMAISAFIKERQELPL